MGRSRCAAASACSTGCWICSPKPEGSGERGGRLLGRRHLGAAAGVSRLARTGPSSPPSGAAWRGERRGRHLGLVLPSGNAAWQARQWHDRPGGVAVAAWLNGQRAAAGRRWSRRRNCGPTRRERRGQPCAGPRAVAGGAGSARPKSGGARGGAVQGQRRPAKPRRSGAGKQRASAVTEVRRRVVALPAAGGHRSGGVAPQRHCPREREPHRA